VKPEVMIVSSARTPLGAFQGALSAVPAPRLGATAIRAALAKANVDPARVTDVMFGQVLSAGVGQAPARQAALQAGLSPSTLCATINKVCGSGLEAVLLGTRALLLGEASLVVAGGMESMSNAPYLLPKARGGFRLGHQQVVDSLVHDGLWDPHGDVHMGSCAEQCAARYSFTREEQDAFAIASFRRANSAQQTGLFVAEIAPVEVAGGKGSPTRCSEDEGPARVVYEKIPTLRPAFDKAGTITPANASTLNDGAAALLLSTAESARELGLVPQARIVAWGSHSAEPLWFTTAPVAAARQALALAQWTVDEVDLWEVNEAFAVVPMAFMRELEVPHDRLNIRGGAIALGHPIGASGARILVTLIAALRDTGRRRGLAAICIGGGEALALCVEIP
jgi:acetyl-CoA C-acetyltransferase